MDMLSNIGISKSSQITIINTLLPLYDHYNEYICSRVYVL